MTDQSDLEALLRAMYPSADAESLSVAARSPGGFTLRILAHLRTEKEKSFSAGADAATMAHADDQGQHDLAAEAAALERAISFVEQDADPSYYRRNVVGDIIENLRKMISPAARTALDERIERERDWALDSAARIADRAAGEEVGNLIRPLKSSAKREGKS